MNRTGIGMTKTGGVSDEDGPALLPMHIIPQFFLVFCPEIALEMPCLHNNRLLHAFTRNPTLMLEISWNDF